MGRHFDRDGHSPLFPLLADVLHGEASVSVEPFDQFWNIYPHRVGKLSARRAFDRALKRGVTLSDILAAVERYVSTKPDWQSWAHPSTWLNQGRWDDEPAEPAHVYTREEYAILQRRRARL